MSQEAEQSVVPTEAGQGSTDLGGACARELQKIVISLFVIEKEEVKAGGPGLKIVSNQKLSSWAFLAESSFLVITISMYRWSVSI